MTPTDHHKAALGDILTAQSLALPEARHHAMLAILAAYFPVTGSVSAVKLPPEGAMAMGIQSTITLDVNGWEHWEGNTYRGCVSADYAMKVLQLGQYEKIGGAQ